MKCSLVRELLSETLEGGQGRTPARDALEHLTECPECRHYHEEIAETWDMMGMLPGAEPSAMFREDLHRRLSENSSAYPPPFALWPRVGWQWMTVAACTVLLVSFMATVSPWKDVPQATDDLAKMDSWDDSFLKDLEQSLNRSAKTYLPVYDSWQTTLREGISVDPGKSQLKEQAGHENEARRRDI